MRVLMLTELYPPIIGGVEQHVRNLSAALARRGHDVSVATLWHEGLAERELDGDVRVHRLRGAVQRAAWLFSDARRRYAPPFPDPRILLGLRRVMERERPQVVHAHGWLMHSFLPLKVGSAVPLVATLHDSGLSCAKKTFLYRGSECDGPSLARCPGCAVEHYGAAKGLPTLLANWGMGPAARAAVDMFLPVSRAIAASNGLVGSQLPFEVVPNFVPDDVAASRAGSDPLLAQLPEGEFLLFVGALGRHKGVHVLLEAYAGLDNAPPLVLIGSAWPDAPTDFPANVVVLRDWPHSAVMEAWRRSLLGLVPSMGLEPCPTVAMEAMASGRPVVASRIGGLPDLVADGETGLLVPPRDPPALAHAVAWLLAHPRDGAAMAARARAELDRYQWNEVGESWERIYRGEAA